MKTNTINRKFALRMAAFPWICRFSYARRARIIHRRKRRSSKAARKMR